MKNKILEILNYRINSLEKSLFLIGDSGDLENVKSDYLSRLDEMESLKEYVETMVEEKWATTTSYVEVC